MLIYAIEQLIAGFVCVDWGVFCLVVRCFCGNWSNSGGID